MSGKYKQAPITEAIFDVKADLDSRISIQNISEIHDRVKDFFPKSKKKIDFRSRLDFKDGEVSAATPESRVTGMIFSTEDDTRQIQFRLDGFTLNIQKPYNSWEEHFPQFLMYWDLYKAEMSPKNVSRIATRFINRIEIPLPHADLKEYLFINPLIPKELPQKLFEYFTRIVLNTEDSRRKIIINQAFEGDQPTNTPIILDIDVYQDEGIKWENAKDFVSEFEILHDLKNKSFEGCITDLTRQLLNNE